MVATMSFLRGAGNEDRAPAILHLSAFKFQLSLDSEGRSK